MDVQLRAFALRKETTEKGIEADVILVEPNGEEHRVRCVCRADGTEIGAEGQTVPYLNKRYGDQAFCGAVRRAALAS